MLKGVPIQSINDRIKHKLFDILKIILTTVEKSYARVTYLEVDFLVSQHESIHICDVANLEATEPLFVGRVDIFNRLNSEKLSTTPCGLHCH